jgi:hypothetical protein
MNQEFNDAERESKLRMQVIYEGAKKPKREWVGLTDEEKQEAYFKIDLWRECIDFIEAKLKDKNT